MASHVSHSDPCAPVSVLVIETVPFLAARLFRIALLCEWMKVSLAEAWTDALAVLGERQFDVLLVNVDTMRWPALEELVALRAAAPGALLVALTAEAEPEISRSCRARGADRVLELHEVLGGLNTIDNQL